MKTRLIQIATLTLLLGGTGLARAAEPASAPRSQIETPAPAQPPAEQRDQIAWQRVGSPLTLEG